MSDEKLENKLIELSHLRPDNSYCLTILDYATLENMGYSQDQSLNYLKNYYQKLKENENK